MSITEIKVGKKTTGIGLLTSIQSATDKEIRVMYGAKYSRMIDDVIYQLLKDKSIQIKIIPELLPFKDKSGNDRIGKRKDAFITRVPTKKK